MCPNIKTATKLVNLTRQIIKLYDNNTGEIVSIVPVVQDLPKNPAIDNSSIYYIVSPKKADQLKKINRSLSDIAILHPCRHCGRDHIMINHLVWGKERQTAVIYTPVHHHLSRR